MLTGTAEARRRHARLLLAEIELAREAGEARPFDTLYLGGGTPSLLEAEDLERLLGAARRRLGAKRRAWIALEANPEDVTAERLEEWRGLGVAMLSLGVQSFDDAELRLLGRRHRAAAAVEAVRLAREGGFESVSLDLIYGLPGQSAEAWRRSLERAVALAPDHLSCYQLTIHEKTPFGFRAARRELAPLPEPAQAELFFLTHRLLAWHGYAAYEVSNFARDERHRSRHNTKYWDHTPYLGLGLGAHSFAWDGSATARRFWNERKVKPWTAKVEAGQRPLAGEESLDHPSLRLEAAMLALRTAEGLDLDHFRERYDFDLFAANQATIERAIDQGHLELAASRLVPTLEGLAIADALAADLVYEEPGPAR